MSRSSFNVEFDVVYAIWLANDVVMLLIKTGEIFFMIFVYDGRLVIWFLYFYVMFDEFVRGVKIFKFFIMFEVFY